MFLAREHSLQCNVHPFEWYETFLMNYTDIFLTLYDHFLKMQHTIYETCERFSNVTFFLKAITFLNYANKILHCVN